MTFYLTRNGQGITTDSTPCRNADRITLTFIGEAADSVCVGGRFYPIKGGVAEIPTEGLCTPAPIVAHALKERRRYVCDAIGQIGEGEERAFAPLVADAEERLASLAIAACALSGRMDALEERIEILTSRIEGTPFTFGGTV